ncbi:MAG: hypothetical protein ACI8TX_001336 [Hyphomicrobiaceae bacterium]|jgi:uncharacterized protein with von Willebrand factor type A (vWA) domain
MRLVYTAWDGTQEVRLDAERIFESLAEHLSRSENLIEALDGLFREGVDDDQFQLVGLDDLLAEVAEAVDELFSTWNLNHSLEAHQSRLDELVDEESEALEGLDDDAAGAVRGKRLATLACAVQEAVDGLGDCSFVSPVAASEAEALFEEAAEIHAVVSFRRQWGDRFLGPRAADFEETLELMAKIEALLGVELALLAGELDEIDLEIVAYLLGADVAEAVELLRQVVSSLVEAGYLADQRSGVSLTAKGARRLGQMALREMVSGLEFDGGGRHETRRTGYSEPIAETHKAYEFGDPMPLDVGATVRNAVLRRGPGVPGQPLKLEASDFEVLESHRDTRSSTVVLLDLSWSMSWEGRFAAAKKVVLALEALMRSRYPHDYFGVVGFYTRAVELDPRGLAEITWNMGDPFTNLQDGLRLGADLLARHPTNNQQLIIITDGQPTAYSYEGRLYCEWPMGVGGLSARATIETLREVERVTRRGVRINTFMLDDSPELRAFVEKMTSINKGRAFYTTPETLGHFVLVDYVGRRRKVL